MTPLRAGDPDQVGGYRLLGRLGEGGQGVVYLAREADSDGGGEGDGGGRVAVKLLRRLDDPDALARFQDEGRILRRVASFCTARVLDSGTEGRLPYLVSEYIEGSSLATAVAERGPLAGSPLFQLAVGTLTALAAIHQNGVAHLDFKPGNVLLGPDGPRVIDFGISRVTRATQTVEELVGTPAFMAPEQLGSNSAGPASDLFAWAGTMVFAATGRPPFPGDALPVIFYGVLHREPDLSALPSGLREVVAACLVKDPARRLSAVDALLRLLGRDLPSEALLAEATAIASGAPRGRGRAVAAVSAVAALALSAAAVLYGLNHGLNGGQAPPAAAPASAAPPTPSSSQRLPGADVVLYERPGDPVRLGSYMTRESGSIGAYARAAAGFRLVARFREPAAAPSGDRTAMITRNKFADGSRDFVEITSPEGTITIPTTSRPVGAYQPRWSRDGRRLVLTTMEETGEARRPRGFVIVDVAARTARAVTVPADEDSGEDDHYFWSPDGTTVAHASGTGVRFHALDGRLVREMRDVGEPVSLGDPFSPSGTRILTRCPDGEGTLCAWDTATGQARGRYPALSRQVYGWYGEDGVLVLDHGAEPYRLVATDRRGGETRHLAEISRAASERWIPQFVPGTR